MMTQKKTKKKAILMGAISPFCDLVREMEQLDIEPVICDYYSDAPAKRMGHPAYDISTTDSDAILELARKEDADGIICAFSDRNLMPAYDVCHTLNLNHFYSREIIECLTDKQMMKKFFSSNGYPVVRYGVVDLDDIDRVEDQFHFPILTKPVDAYGSKGIFLCQNTDDIKAVSEKVLKQSLKYQNKIIIEEFYNADEISISAWVRDGKAYITCIYDVFRNIGDTITLSAVSFPSKYTTAELDNFDVLLNSIVSDRGIQEGPVTLQCFIGEEGIKVSELLCRLAGGSPYLYPTYFGGPNVAKMMIAYSVGDDIDYQNLMAFEPVIQEDEVYYDIQLMVNCKGRIHYDFDKDYVLKENPEITDLIVYYQNGHKLVNVGMSGVIFAKIICRTKRNASYYDLVKRLEDSIIVYDENGKKSSFISRPERFNVTDRYDIDWDFLNK